MLFIVLCLLWLTYTQASIIAPRAAHADNLSERSRTHTNRQHRAYRTFGSLKKESNKVGRFSTLILNNPSRSNYTASDSTINTESGGKSIHNGTFSSKDSRNNNTVSNFTISNPSDSSFKMTIGDIFSQPIDTKPPFPEIGVRSDHPVPRKGIITDGPLQTNKFYSNFFLGDQLGPTYTFPYSVAWSGGKGVAASWGMYCSHIEERQRVYGDKKENGAASYFLSPVGIQSMIVSAKELGNGTTLTMDSITAFSARVHLSKTKTSPPDISFPLIQGMAYFTAQFSGATPIIQSAVFFRTMTRVTRDPKEHVTKYTFTLEDSTIWRVYGWRTKGDELDLKVINNGLAESTKPFFGILQVCKDPGTAESEALLDDGAGIFPTTLALSGSVSGSEGRYSFKFEKSGHQQGNLYMYALPHHVDSFDGDTRQRLEKVQLQTTTKGLATLVKGKEWTMLEPRLPNQMGFDPWDLSKGSLNKMSDNAKAIIRSAAAVELSQNIIAQSDLDSMYFSGKVRLHAFSILMHFC